MKRFIAIIALVLVWTTWANAQTASQLARKIYSGTGVPTLNCAPGPIWRDVYIRTSTGIWYQCTAAPNTWTAIASGGAPDSATYITQTPNATLTNEQALSALASGIMRVATATGAVTALTNSAGIAANISDETGSGLLVFGTSPNITTPTGIVKGDVGLGNADNTSDAAKPVSTATQAALDLKAGLAAGNSFTTGQLIQPTTDVPALTLRRNDISHSSLSLSIQEEDNDVVASISKAGDFLGTGYTSTGQTYCVNTACTVFIKAGAGAPEGVVTGGIGSIWQRTDGGTDTSLYRKESGTGNTGWVAVAAGGSGTTINASDGVIPYRSSATVFANSPITRTSSTTVSVTNVEDPAGYWKLFGGSTGRVELNGGISLVWNSTGTPDIGISRHTVGVLRFTDGSTAETLGGTYSAIATTPTQIAANQDNYNPGGSSYLQRWSSDASRNVTGLTFTAAQVSGQTHMLCNIGAQNIVLTHDDGSTSTAANRFKLKGATNRTVVPDECVTAVYDATTARWRVAN